MAEKLTHFGVQLIKRKYSFKLCRDEFALISTKPSFEIALSSLRAKNAYVDDTCTEYRREWCEEYRALCLENFDFNMRFFECLDSQEFNVELVRFLKKHDGFFPVTDLKECYGRAGYYIMVLDQYKQMYVGKSDHVGERIKQHWSNTKAFDRTLLPVYNTQSVFSVDFFRALDTSRIFVWYSRLSEGIERELVSDVPKKFSLNRVGGDITTLMEAIATFHDHKHNTE